MKNLKLCIGIDVSKEYLDVTSTTNGEQFNQSFKVKNNLAGFKKIESNFKKMKIKEVQFYLESTGIYSKAISDYLWAQGYLVSIINPLRTKSYRKTLFLRTKTDLIDAQLIASYGAKIAPKASQKPKIELSQFKNMVRHLNYLIEKKAAEESHLESARDAIIRASILEMISCYEKEIQKIKTDIANFLDNNDKIKKDITLLKSIPGIGDTAAFLILTELITEESEKYNRRIQVAHAGLAPAKHESGTSIRGQERICRLGNSRLRKALFFPALCAIRYNPIIQKFYKKLVSKGKKKMVAVVAVMKKLLLLAIGILNNQKPFDAVWISVHPALKPKAVCM